MLNSSEYPSGITVIVKDPVPIVDLVVETDVFHVGDWPVEGTRLTTKILVLINNCIRSRAIVTGKTKRSNFIVPPLVGPVTRKHSVDVGI